VSSISRRASGTRYTRRTVDAGPARQPTLDRVAVVDSRAWAAPKPTARPTGTRISWRPVWVSSGSKTAIDVASVSSPKTATRQSCVAIASRSATAGSYPLLPKLPAQGEIEHFHRGRAPKVIFTTGVLSRLRPPRAGAGGGGRNGTAASPANRRRRRARRRRPSRCRALLGRTEAERHGASGPPAASGLGVDLHVGHRGNPKPSCYRADDDCSVRSRTTTAT